LILRVGKAYPDMKNIFVSGSNLLNFLANSMPFILGIIISVSSISIRFDFLGTIHKSKFVADIASR
jgi:hypothetical protein